MRHNVVASKPPSHPSNLLVKKMGQTFEVSYFSPKEKLHEPKFLHRWNLKMVFFWKRIFFWEPSFSGSSRQFFGWIMTWLLISSEHVDDIFSDEFLYHIGLTFLSPVDNCNYSQKKTSVFHHPNWSNFVHPQREKKTPFDFSFFRQQMYKRHVIFSKWKLQQLFGISFRSERKNSHPRKVWMIPLDADHSSFKTFDGFFLETNGSYYHSGLPPSLLEWAQQGGTILARGF